MHEKLLKEILEIITHVLKRINSNNFYDIIPTKKLLTMLYEHINYYQYHNDFYLSSYFLNLTMTFIDVSIKNYIKSLHSKHLNDSSFSSTIKLPKNDLNVDDNNDDKQLFINKELIQSIFQILTVMDKFPSLDHHSYKVFHFFIQILPFIKYSNENVDKNAKFFSKLFKIDFDQLTKDYQNKIKENENKDEQDDDDDDDNDDDDNDEDNDIDMDDNKEEKKMEVDIVKEIANSRNINRDLKTAIILTNPTPKSSLSHIKMLIKYCQYFLFCGYVSNDKVKNNNDRKPLPGLSKFIYKQVTNNYKLLTNKFFLQEMKTSIIEFFYFIGIQCQMISIQEIYISSLIYNYSSNKVYGKIKGEIDLEDEMLINQLYDLYLGSAKNNNAMNKILACNLSLKILIIKNLSKSTRACSNYTKAVKVIFDALFSPTTYDKLKLNGLELIKAIFIKCGKSNNNSKLIKLLPIFKQGLLKLLRLKKQSQEKEYIEKAKIRGIAYSLIGDLSTLPNATKLFTLNLDILILYFDRLNTEQSFELKTSILNGLGSLKNCYMKEINTNNNTSLSQILLNFLLKKINNDKQISNIKIILQWLNDIYPFNNAQIRMINILQLTYNDINIKEYAKKGIGPRIKNRKLQKYPLFPEFINVAYSSIFEQKQNISKTIIEETINFASKCLSGNSIIWMTENKEKETDENKDEKMDVDENKDEDENNNVLLNWLESNDELNWLQANQSLYKSLTLQSKYIKHQLNTSSSNLYNDYLDGFEKYLKLLIYSIEHFPISQAQTQTLHSNSFQYLIQLICCCYPSFNINNGNNNLSKLFKNMLFDKNNLNLFYQRQLKDSVLTRVNISKLFGIITLLSSKETDNETMNQYQSMLLSSISSQVLNKGNNKNKSKSNILNNFTLQEMLEIDGALKGLSCIMSAKLYQNKQNLDISYNLMARFCSMFVLSKSMDLINSSCYCLTMFSKYDAKNLLNIRDSYNTNELSKLLNIDIKHINNIVNCIKICDENNENKTDYVLSLIENLVLIIKRFNKNQQYIAEASIQAISSICSGINDISYFTEIEKHIFSLKKLPQHDLHFFIGCIWINIVLNASENDKYVSKILNKICKEEIKEGNKLSRCSSCIWLLCIVRFCGHSKYVQDKLLMIQSSFILLLSDTNEFTVQCASKGIINCYQIAKKLNNEELDLSLLKSLMSTLTSNNASVSINKTYRELCQISKKLGEPKLIYGLFDLVSNNAIFNTKFCDAFSIKDSLKQISKELLNDRVDKIIPILFRYKFDTNLQIRATMQDLWKIIIIDNDENNENIIIEKYYDLLMEQMISGLQSNEWKVRASTPLAICSLLSDKTLNFNKISKYLKRLIENLFLTIQDINSVVQKSSLQFSQLILNIIERFTNKQITKSKYIIEALDIIVPIITIQTRSKQVQLLSVTILLKICTKNTDKYLIPHLKELIKVLLYGLSTLEPKELNYLNVQDQGKEFADKVENARLKIDQQNPLNNALNFCVNLITDKETINAVIPELVSIIKGGVGLNSINSCCKILIDLSKKENLRKVLKKHSKKVMNALLQQVVNTPSPHLKKMYSQVIAYWFQFVKKKYVENTVTLIENLYFNDETNGGVNDDDKRILSGIITFNISKYALNVISNYTRIVSLAFIASNDINEDCSDYWTKAITEFGGKQICLKQNMDVVLELIIQTFNDTIYKKKQTAIISIKDLCELYGDSLNNKYLEILINKIILKSLPGKIWDGKVKLFEALITVTKYCKMYLNKDNNLKQNIIKSLLNEVKRKNKQEIDYKIAAINCLSDCIINMNFSENVDESIIIFKEYIFNENIFNNKDKKYFELLSCSIKCIGSIWSGNEIIQQNNLSWIINNCYIYYLTKTDWMVQISIYKSIQSFFNKLNLNIFTNNNDNKLLLYALIEKGIIEIGFNNLKFTAIRNLSLCALYELLMKLKRNNNNNIIDKDLMNKIKTKIDFMANNDNQPVVVQQAIKIQKEIY